MRCLRCFALALLLRFFVVTLGMMHDVGTVVQLDYPAVAGGGHPYLPVFGTAAVLAAGHRKVQIVTAARFLETVREITGQTY